MYRLSLQKIAIFIKNNKYESKLAAYFQRQNNSGCVTGLFAHINKIGKLIYKKNI